jgi:hypothetical protein
MKIACKSVPWVKGTTRAPDYGGVNRNSYHSLSAITQGAFLLLPLFR